MSVALTEKPRSMPDVDPASADGGPAVLLRPALVAMAAASCGIAAITLAQLWLARAPILDFSL